MDKVLGLGKVGCKIATAFERYPQYEVYKIGSAQNSAPNFFQVEKQDHPQDYEDNCPDFSGFLKDLEGNLLFVLSGSSMISGLSLRLLEQIRHKCTINVLYVKPDKDFLDSVKTLQENLVFNVFQEYARSGVFNQVYIVENDAIGEIIKGAPIIGYFDKLNELIVSTIHMINVFDNSDAIESTFTQPFETCRISTFGIVNMEEKQENVFFPLDEVKEKWYYYGISENKLKTDENLFNMITSQIKEKAKEGIKASYGIFSTDYENDYVYCVARSSTVQKN
jgi:hypothetical protein